MTPPGGEEESKHEESDEECAVPSNGPDENSQLHARSINPKSKGLISTNIQNVKQHPRPASPGLLVGRS